MSFKFWQLLAESHRRQLEGQDFQKVATDLCVENDFDMESEECPEYELLETGPDHECDCHTCQTFDWKGWD